MRRTLACRFVAALARAGGAVSAGMIDQRINFNGAGLIPAIVQDHATGEVLMLAYMNAESLNKTLETGETWFWSRSRESLWHKGETSGNTQRVVSMSLDCVPNGTMPRCGGALSCSAAT